MGRIWVWTPGSKGFKKFTQLKGPIFGGEILISGWWLNQPIWKTIESKWESSPRAEKTKMFEKPPPSCFIMNGANVEQYEPCGKYVKYVETLILKSLKSSTLSPYTFGFPITFCIILRPMKFTQLPSSPGCIKHLAFRSRSCQWNLGVWGMPWGHHQCKRECLCMTSSSKCSVIHIPSMKIVSITMATVEIWSCLVRE